MDATSLHLDPEGLAFLREALGNSGVMETAGRRFPSELWSPKPADAPRSEAMLVAVAPSPERVEPRFADALA